ncbi:MAG TPA: CHASE domain-containing protein [Bacteroidales bacterium]|nr:CHASE domain-containing protein [Bacteroidales bacterium]
MKKGKTKGNGLLNGKIRLGIIGMLFSLLIFAIIHLNEQKKAINELNNLSEDIHKRISSRLYLHQQLLRATAAFFQASDSVEMDSWDTFISYPGMIGTLPGTRSIAYISSVNDSSTSISYIEPVGRNRRMIGFDMFSEPVRRKAMELARDSNKVIITGKIHLNLISDTSSQYGLLMFAPVYRKNSPVNTVEERRESIKGWIFSPFAVKNFVKSVIDSEDLFANQRIDFNIYDSDISEESMLFRTNDSTGEKRNNTISIPLVFNDHTWMLQFKHNRSFYHLSTIEVIILICGIIVSALLCILDRSFRNTHSRALTIAEERTKELKDSEERFRTVVQTLPSLLTITNKKGENIFVSSNSELFTGYKPEHIPLSGLFWVHNDDIEKIPNFTSDSYIAADTKARSFKYKAIKKNGEIWYAHTSWALQTTPDGSFNGIVFQTVDITEIKQAEDAIIESENNLKKINATKDKFFSIIAHDLRSPFNAILGFTVLIEEQLKNGNIDKATKLTKMINVSAEQTLIMLENLLDWSTTQTDNMSFNPGYYFVNPLIQQVLTIMNTASSVKNITINYKDETGNLCIFVDMNMFDIIVRNLLSNAIKFTCPGGKIDITTSSKNDKIEISIEDNGVGMEPEIIDKIFSLESGISTLGTAHEKGSGIGLKLCKELIEKNNGQLIVQSHPQSGSKFIINMPGKNFFNEINQS